jgi:hypothetical protein
MDLAAGLPLADQGEAEQVVAALPDPELLTEDVYRGDDVAGRDLPVVVHPHHDLDVEVVQPDVIRRLGDEVGRRRRHRLGERAREALE